MIGTMWAKAMDESLGAGRAVTRAAALGEVEHWCAQRTNGADVLAGFHALATDEAA
jgi:hypothetical protein